MVTAEVFQRELGAFRDEMRMAFDRLRDEMRAVRDEMHAGFDGLRKADGALRVEIAKTPFETFKWLLAAGGLAAAIATAIYDIWFRSFAPRGQRHRAIPPTGRSEPVRRPSARACL